MTEQHPGAERRADDARRAALMFATLGFAALPRIPADMAPVFGALHRWLDSWRGIGDLVTGMNRQAYDLELTQYLGEDALARCPAGRGSRARPDRAGNLKTAPIAASLGRKVRRPLE